MIDLETLRKDKKITQQVIAETVGLSRQTYSRIEKGEIDLTLGQAVRLADYFDISVNDMIDDNTETSIYEESNFDREKYKQIIKNFIAYGGDNHDHKITKTKLAKLCYLLDFTRFYNHLTPITGLQYRRIQQGPVPDIYFTTIEELIEDESILLEVKGSAHMISNIIDAQDNLLSTDEKSLIQEIATKRKPSNTKEIVTFTHKQLPRMMCDDKEIIPYSFITQEDSSNVY